MVDALRRVHRIVTPAGIVVDVHPTEIPAAVYVDGCAAGDLDAEDAPIRHAAAGAALRTAIDEGWFGEVASTEFVFFTYADTIEELRDHIAANWRNTRIGLATVAQAQKALESAPAGTRPAVREHVRLTVLRPLDHDDRPHV